MINEQEEIELITRIGQRIKQARLDKGLKQIELATSLGIEDSALRRIESGRTNPTIKTLFRIATELEVSLSELIEVSPK